MTIFDPEIFDPEIFHTTDSETEPDLNGYWHSSYWDVNYYAGYWPIYGAAPPEPPEPPSVTSELFVKVIEAMEAVSTGYTFVDYRYCKRGLADHTLIDDILEAM